MSDTSTATNTNTTKDGTEMTEATEDFTVATPKAFAASTMLTRAEDDLAQSLFWKFENARGVEPTTVELARYLEIEADACTDSEDADAMRAAARKWRPGRHRLFWIAIGGFEDVVEIYVEAGRVYVDADTLECMAADIVECGLGSEEDDAAYAAEIRATKPTTDTLSEVTGEWFDVTEFGGDMWSDQLTMSECAECMSDRTLAHMIGKRAAGTFVVLPEPRTPAADGEAVCGVANVNAAPAERCHLAAGHTGNHETLMSYGHVMWPEAPMAGDVRDLPASLCVECGLDSDSPRHSDLFGNGDGRHTFRPETDRQPTTEAGRSLADGERDGLTALIVEVEDEARRLGPVAYPWQGKPKWTHMTRGRGSAAGGNFYGNPWHVFAGMTADGRDVARCGLVFAGATTQTTKPRGDEPVCVVCQP